MTTPIFDHERLDVYRASIQFNAWVGALLDRMLTKCSIDARKHMDEAACSIPLNIAEGNGRRSHRDRCKFLDIARGSTLECAACLDVLVSRGVLREEDVAEGKGLLVRITEMLYKLIQRMLPGEAL